MRRTSALLLATAALAMASSSGMPLVGGPLDPFERANQPRPRRREDPTEPEPPRTVASALRREIAAHNAAVDARRAEKLARRGTNRKG